MYFKLQGTPDSYCIRYLKYVYSMREQIIILFIEILYRYTSNYFDEIKKSHLIVATSKVIRC